MSNSRKGVIEAWLEEHTNQKQALEQAPKVEKEEFLHSLGKYLHDAPLFIDEESGEVEEGEPAEEEEVAVVKFFKNSWADKYRGHEGLWTWLGKNPDQADKLIEAKNVDRKQFLQKLVSYLDRRFDRAPQFEPEQKPTGLYDKYTVIKKENERHIKDAFVLRTHDLAALGALIRYAGLTSDEDLKADLINRVLAQLAHPEQIRWGKARHTLTRTHLLAWLHEILKG